MIRIFSWNVLYPDYGTVDRFPYCTLEELAWSNRLPRILNQITKCQADIICLQEIDATTVETDFVNPLQALGYRAVCQIKKKNQKKLTQYRANPSLEKPHALICVTFYRTNRFLFINCHVHSRFLTINLLNLTTGTLLQVANVHLPSKETSVEQRRHLEFLMAEDFQENEKTTARFIVGDFNMHPDGDVLKIYLNSHNFTPMPDQGLTFKTLFLEGIFDYIWVSPQYKLTVRHHYDEPVLVPSAEWPSDHIPIAGDFHPVLGKQRDGSSEDPHFSNLTFY